MKITKMHGAGNDYIYINCFEENIADPAALCIKLADRHFGVGGDGIILIMPSETADFRMRMFNSLDGSEGMMCGNAIRCVGKYVYDREMTHKTEVTIETASGIKTLRLNVEDGVVETVRVDMGEPIQKPDQNSGQNHTGGVCRSTGKRRRVYIQFYLHIDGQSACCYVPGGYRLFEN